MIDWVEPSMLAMSLRWMTCFWAAVSRISTVVWVSVSSRPE
jgi:hypothetical protein